MAGHASTSGDAGVQERRVPGNSARALALLLDAFEPSWVRRLSPRFLLPWPADPAILAHELVAQRARVADLLDVLTWTEQGQLDRRLIPSERRSMLVRWRPFEEAREFARGLGFTTKKEWLAFARSAARPPDIPKMPSSCYRDQGWCG
jgi:hypothetical protein